MWWFCPFLFSFNPNPYFSKITCVFLYILLILDFVPITLSSSFNLVNMDNISIKDLSFSCINCNSLNMSDSRKGLQKNKVYGIAKLKSDIIFLSDVRMSSRNKISSFSDISTAFRINPYNSYKLLYNSSMNKRGVGILIKHDILFTEAAREEDDEENFLLVKVDIKGKTLILGSIYGPNSHCPNFFVKLKNSLDRLGNFPIILGGDWNCTFSVDPSVNNIDCLNMTNPPNVRHSVLLNTICEELDLIDPFRALHPNRKDFTFCPRNINQNNRSRIDYFII